MRKRSVSLRRRLLLANVTIILSGIGLMTLFAGYQQAIAIRNDFNTRFVSDVRLIADAVSPVIQDWASGKLDDAALTSILDDYEIQNDALLTLYFTGLEHLPERLTARYRLPNDDMSEIQRAMQRDVIVVERPDDKGANKIFTAASIMNKRDPIGLLQMSVPVQVRERLIIERWLILLIGFGVLTTIAVAATLWLSRTITSPLYLLRESTIRFSGGDLSYRVPAMRADEIGEVAQAFNSMADRLQGLIDEQRAFINNASHELRTPLTTIRLRAEALQARSLSVATTGQHYVKDIITEAGHLSTLIQALTLLSTFDMHRAEMGHDQIDVLHFAQSMIERCAAEAERKQIVLSLSVSDAWPAASPVLIASASHLIVVFQNILGNALKYTPAGGRILWQMEIVGGSVLHTINDTGSGIEAQHLPRVFERFYRADAARSRDDIPGTGLGLSLVKSIVDAYSGTIRITSAGRDQGTEVSVFWPCDVRAIDILTS